MSNSLLWTPLAFGLVGLFVPRRLTGWWATLGTVATLGIAIAVVIGFDSGASGLQDTVDVTWISGLGVDYSLGVDGLNVFLLLLTAVLWTAATAFAAFREQDRPHLFFLMMLLAETATLGSFLSQDLLLFVLFFDLMLVPFYFLFGAWGSDREDGPTAVGGDDEDDRLHAGRFAADAGRGDRDRDHRRRRRPHHLLDRRTGEPPARRRAASAGSSGSSPSPSWSRCRPSSSTAGCPTPTGRRRCRCWPCSRACWRRSAPTASSAWSCRSSPTRPSSSRRSCW